MKLPVLVLVFFFLFFVDTITDAPHLLPLFIPLHPASHTPHPAFTRLLCVSMGHAYMYICFLTNLFQSSLVLSPQRSVSLFHVSMPVFLLCASAYFVH